MKIRTAWEKSSFKNKINPKEEDEQDKKLKERMKLPKDLRKIIKTENEQMDHILNDFGYKYEGTEVMEDAKRIRRADVLEYLDDDEDPFEKLGHGVMSYFRMMESVVCSFLIFSILAIPLLTYYS